ncbi:hypothetical protein AIGOOFII_0854 [Methylobacterium marchantiae]|nr:hypothetical protein AIGOOFII_0854 [Methylobacterium marchantiae]
MRIYRSSLAIAYSVFLAAATAACSIHPVPEDVTGVTTLEIANKIRCEAFYAVNDILIDFIKRKNFRNADKILKILNENPASLKNLPYDKIEPELSKLLDKYDGTAIALDFTFDMTETNKISTELGILSIIANNSDALSLKGSSDRTRKNIRNFRIVKTIKELYLKGEECAKPTNQVNYAYPITGNIGIREVLDTFFGLNETLLLSENAKDKTVLFADTITFTTTFNGSASPAVLLSSLARSTTIGTFNLVLDGGRTDTHTLIIAISLPPDKNYFPVTSAKERANVEVDLQIQKNQFIPVLLNR